MLILSMIGACTCSSYKIGKYGNCEEDGYGKGKFCYVNLPNSCSDAQQSQYTSNYELSWVACLGEFLVLA